MTDFKDVHNLYTVQGHATLRIDVLPYVVYVRYSVSYSIR